jgi:hypothetical protein
MPVKQVGLLVGDHVAEIQAPTIMKIDTTLIPIAIS